MLGSIPARSILLLSLLTLSACAAVDARSPSADPSEDTAATTTRYEFEFDCPPSGKFRIAGTTQWVDDHGYRSQVSELRIGAKPLAKRWIDEINRRIPAEAYQERPWLTCSGGGASIELRFVDRNDGSVARSPRLKFIVHREGTLEFLD